LPPVLCSPMRKRKMQYQIENEHPRVHDAKPVVLIATTVPASEDAIRWIMWGLEEEGIPAEIQKVTAGSTKAVAKQAADGSKLNVGIGINGTKKEIVLHHRDLPQEKPLFTLTDEKFQAEHLRRMGANAARLVKGDPLLFLEETGIPTQRQQDRPEAPGEQSRNQLTELVARLVAESLVNT